VHLRKLAIALHRWLGVFFCLLLATWFLSGMVMMYWTYPEVSAADRLARAQPLDASRVRVTPIQALSLLGGAPGPSQVLLEVLDGRPVYRFRLGRAERIVFADNGKMMGELSAFTALRIAAAWTGQPESAARFDGSLTEEDQWTVSGSFRALRPLLKYSWPDGEQVYISTVTAQVEQYTRRADRIAAYFGAIPHWLYFTPLRKNGPLWSRVVIWSSGVATAVSMLGLIVGTWISLPAKRIPYLGMKRWHTVLGLVFGAMASTWAFSGMLSMDPFPIQDDDESAPVIASALRGGKLKLADFGGMDARQPLTQIGSSFRAKQLELAMFASEPVYIARQSPEQQRVVAVNGQVMGEFSHDRILQLVARAVEPERIVETRLVNEYEAYYLDRHHQRPLPVLFVRLNDPRRSMFYIDPRTARIVDSYGAGSRLNRWLYHGLHSIDLPWLYKHRPAWDILVLAMLLGGSALCVTSIVLAAQFLKRKMI